MNIILSLSIGYVLTLLFSFWMSFLVSGGYVSRTPLKLEGKCWIVLSPAIYMAFLVQFLRPLLAPTIENFVTIASTLVVGILIGIVIGLRAPDPRGGAR